MQTRNSTPLDQFPEKLRELTMYVAWLRRDDPHFGATLLNKCLYYCDFDSYRHTGRAVTGAEYVKEKFGPVPRGFNDMRNSMIKAGDIIMRTEGDDDFPVNRMIPARKADLSLFTGDEIAHVNAVVDRVAQSSATEISRMSHGHVWNILDMHEVIPYSYAFVSDEPPTEREIEIARQLVKAKGWDA